MVPEEIEMEMVTQMWMMQLMAMGVDVEMETLQQMEEEPTPTGAPGGGWLSCAPRVVGAASRADLGGCREKRSRRRRGEEPERAVACCLFQCFTRLISLFFHFALWYVVVGGVAVTFPPHASLPQPLYPPLPSELRVQFRSDSLTV